MAQKIFTDESLKTLVDEVKTYVDTTATTKADKTHSHSISNITNLQSTLDGKAAASHGTHVSYSTTSPVMDGTASVGSASTVARSDHKHPTDTSRASQVDLDSLETVVAGKAPSSHTHSIANITNLQTTLDGKASSSHTHKVANISDLTATVTELNYMDGVTSNVQTQLDGKSASSHTHNYAGSSSVGGSATSAVKLDTSTAGDANTPVYFSGGKPVACTSLDLNTSGSSASCTGNAATATNVAWSGVTSKPSYYDAKAIKGITRSGTTFTYTCMDGTTGTFTQQDNNTTYSVATTSANGLMSSSDKSKLDGIASGANNYTLPAAGSSLGGVKTGGDVTISNGTITVNDDSHNHIVSNIDGLQTTLNDKLSMSTGGTVNGNTSLRSYSSVSDGVMADSTITSRSTIDATSGLPTAIASMGVTNSSSTTNYGSATITANYLNEVVLNTSYRSDMSTIKLTPTKATIDTPFVSSYPGWQTIKVSHGTSGIESGFTAERTDTNTCVRFGVGAAGVNHGVWSHTQNRWLIHGNANNIFIGENRAYGEKELYNDTTGTADTITLSDSAANYTYLEIYYKDNNSREFNSTKIYSPNGKSTDLFLVEAVASSTLIRRTRYNISGNKLTPDLTTAGYIQIYHNGTANKVGSETNYLRIVRVVGLV